MIFGVFILSIIVRCTLNELEDPKSPDPQAPQGSTTLTEGQSTSIEEIQQSSDLPLIFSQEEKYTPPPNPTEEVINQLPYGFTFSTSTITGLCLVAVILILFVFWKCCLKSATRTGEIRDDIQATLNDDIDEDIQITLDVDDGDDAYDANDDKNVHDV